MKGFNIEGKDGKYKAIPVNILNSEGKIDEDLLIAADVVLRDNSHKIYVLEYNKARYMVFSALSQLNEELEPKVVRALKRDGVFQELTVSDDADVDDELIEFKLFTIEV